MSDQFETAYAEALDTSADAYFASLNSYGDRMDCGSAWIVIPGRSAFGRWAKAKGLTDGKHHAGGLILPILRGAATQSRLHKEKGCDAFVDTLARHGVEAHVYSYAD